ncbi:MAG TPA: hypothetical protein ENF29_04630 [Candidatus Acetothermia bacterium]|nr:hypothetical protein [Candidatus Acetothermia bacterium]
MRRKLKIGLALGGGGARGFAHLGIIMALEEHGIPIDVITGTSMGAAVGAAKALGMDLGKLHSVLSLLNLNSLLGVSESTSHEIRRAIGRGVVEYMRGVDLEEETSLSERLSRLLALFSLLTAKKDFAATQVPFAVVAADLATGARVVLREGPIYRAVAASAAVPGIFPPVRIEGKYLIDGGVIEKIPIAAAIELGANAVIAVDAGAPMEKVRAQTSLDVMFQSQRITSHALTALQIEEARKRLNGRLVLLRPQVSGITMLAFSKLSQAVKAGKEEVLARLPEISESCGVRPVSPDSKQ